ncbi:unnamed protein product [Phytophthora lilii]|uniref:Unnamed protein product n=1 Tax=Phytophthora lilii TaxID=2077276 RepID=A0A9W6XF12_9STRA|nr:unnamed protein product [Phytophthora lilii]
MLGSVLVLFVAANAVSALENTAQGNQSSLIHNISPLLTMNTTMAITTRHLRSHHDSRMNEAENDPSTEERGGNLGLSKLAKLATKFGSPAESLTNKAWLKAKVNPEVVYADLHLGHKLEENPKFLQWLRYTVAYRAKMGGSIWFMNEEIYGLLAKTTSEADIALLFQSLKQVPDLNALAKALQITQFKKWIADGARREDIVKLLGATHSLPTSDPKSEILDEFTLLLVGTSIRNIP